MVQTPTQLLILETFLQLPETKHWSRKSCCVEKGRSISEENQSEGRCNQLNTLNEATVPAK